MTTKQQTKEHTRRIIKKYERTLRLLENRSPEFGAGWTAGVEACATVLFNLTQSHDCNEDTACDLEDRLFGAIGKIEHLRNMYVKYDEKLASET